MVGTVRMPNWHRFHFWGSSLGWLGAASQQTETSRKGKAKAGHLLVTESRFKLHCVLCLVDKEYLWGI